jgi:hypothetical protein
VPHLLGEQQEQNCVNRYLDHQGRLWHRPRILFKDKHKYKNQTSDPGGEPHHLHTQKTR